MCPGQLIRAIFGGGNDTPPAPTPTAPAAVVAVKIKSLLLGFFLSESDIFIIFNLL